MGFKDCCCGLCAWFSVIGALTFSFICIMLYNNNLPVIEHKFGLTADKTKEIDAARIQMIVMTLVMGASAFGCFFSSFMFARSE